MKKLLITFDEALEQSGFKSNNHDDRESTQYVYCKFVHICRKAMDFYYNVAIDDISFAYMYMINKDFIQSSRRRKGAILKTKFKEAYIEIVKNNNSDACIQRY